MTGQLQIKLCESEAEGKAWNKFVKVAPGATVYHRWEWREIYRSSFGFTPRYWGAFINGELIGVFPGVFMRGLNFRRHWVSLPFITAAGPCATSDENWNALLDGVMKDEAPYVSVQVRTLGNRACPGWKTQADSVTCVLRLSSEETLWKESLRGKVRNQVGKAMKNGVTTRRGGAELIPGFYRIWNRRMWELGTPAFPERFFKEILRTFGEDAWIRIVEVGNLMVGGMLLLKNGNRIADPWAATLRDFDRVCANNLLCWKAIQEACRLEIAYFDMGRSPRGSTTLRFKESWGARPEPLSYLIRPGKKSGPFSQQNFSLASRIWSQVPMKATNKMGPMVVRFLTEL